MLVGFLTCGKRLNPNARSDITVTSSGYNFSGFTKVPPEKYKSLLKCIRRLNNNQGLKFDLLSTSAVALGPVQTRHSQVK